MPSGPQHYKTAVAQLKTIAQNSNRDTDVLLVEALAAQAHATLALAAAVAEGVVDGPYGRPLVQRPLAADGPDPAYPGNAWGRALYGDLPTNDQKDS